MHPAGQDLGRRKKVRNACSGRPWTVAYWLTGHFRSAQKGLPAMKILFAVMFAVMSITATACLDAPPIEGAAELAVENCPAPQLQGGFMDMDNACPDPQFPSCAVLGCVSRPSGTPNIWTPCNTELCYCGNPAKRCVQ